MSADGGLSDAYPFNGCCKVARHACAVESSVRAAAHRHAKEYGRTHAHHKIVGNRDAVCDFRVRIKSLFAVGEALEAIIMCRCIKPGGRHRESCVGARENRCAFVPPDSHKTLEFKRGAC